MATEDGVVLAECISRAKTPEELPFYLEAFESVRKERCFLVQSGSVKNEDFWHMEDGARQRARDAMMRNEEIDAQTLEELRNEGKNPNQWADPTFQSWLFGYDAIAEATRVLDELEGKNSDAGVTNPEGTGPVKAVQVN